MNTQTLRITNKLPYDPWWYLPCERLVLVLVTVAFYVSRPFFALLWYGTPDKRSFD